MYYLFSKYSGKTVVWISEKIRPEHIKAIETLNEITMMTIISMP